MYVRNAEEYWDEDFGIGRWVNAGGDLIC